MRAVLADKDFVQRIEALGGKPLDLSERDFEGFVTNEQRKWKAVVTKNKIAKE